MSTGPLVIKEQAQPGKSGRRRSMAQNYVIIGFMGSGKTTVSRILARKYGYRLLDTDSLIEQQERRSVSSIFEEYGEEGFRNRETILLRTLAGKAALGGFSGRTVLSTGGGIILREENRLLLRRIGEVVYLSIRPETVLERLSSDKKRPLLQGPDRERKVRELMAAREHLYLEAADRILRVDEGTPEGTAELILKGSSSGD